MDEELANEIGLAGQPQPLRINGITAAQEVSSMVVEFKIKGRKQQEYESIRARTMKDLRLGGQSIKAESLRYAHLKGVPLEEVCYDEARPRLLIGSDNWHLIVTRRLLTGKRDQPAASLTKLGWVIHGVTPKSTLTTEGDVLHVTMSEKDSELHNLVKAHFDIDALGISKHRRPTTSEARACQIFENTVKQVDGKYEVGLPWKEENVNMPASYDMARKRLLAIERKMDKSADFEAAYTSQIEKLLEKGYAEECNDEHLGDTKLWYLPHFAVTNPNKPGKMRVVFDAAAQASGVSLNDVLLDGPDLLHSLPGVIFRFRENPFAITADIREMFLQVKIRKEDQAAQHFLWRGRDRDKPPRRYVMTSMIFGARSSPFLAHSVRDRCARDNENEYPLAVEAITRNHYMDDWLDSFRSEEEAKETIRQVVNVYSKSGFELAGWGASLPSLLRDVPQSNIASAPLELGNSAHTTEKTLGILWEVTSDTLMFNTNMHRVPAEVKDFTRTPTKREALATVMSLFDPLGLLSPYTITAKIVLQSLWRQQLGWDDEIPPEEAAAFAAWMRDIEYIKALRLPRCYHTSDIVNKEVHIFCDASEQAFAAVAYWRTTLANGEIIVTMIAAKSKVAPIKAQSIPRLELQACLVGARLASTIAKEHRWSGPITLWSDAKTALYWIRNESARYTPYVAHRLTEIGDLTRAEQWKWVPTHLNPADIATRTGNTCLSNNHPWFIGPEFLKSPYADWPVEPDATPLDEEVTVSHIVEEPPVIDFTRFSSYKRLVRTLACVYAFADKCRGRAQGITFGHIRRAEVELVRLSQRESFPDEIVRLSKGEAIARDSRLNRLDPGLDDGGVLRLRGRTRAALVAHEAEPPILDGRHHLTRLIIEDEHRSNHHIGREHLISNLRQKYWVLRVRTVVRTILNQCVTCKVRRGVPRNPTMGDLPRDRMKPFEHPFTYCGVDGFGPMWVTIGRRREKRWGLIFTCLVARAIHIETLASLSTDSALLAFRRMGARRGWPKIVWSDNGTNFHGADAELRKAHLEWRDTLTTFGSFKGTEWRFIDPGAPNQGGAWERMIRSVKSALAVTLESRAPREEILNTLLTEVEHTVNSRPLTHVSVDSEEEDSLTPNHFLIGRPTGLPLVGRNLSIEYKTWKSAQMLANSFWNRWVKEYLPTLMPRLETRKLNQALKVNDLVIIADGLLPRNVWPRGRIVRTFTGPDGIVRSADVNTRGGVFRRPVRRLIILPDVVRLRDSAPGGDCCG